VGNQRVVRKEVLAHCAQKLKMQNNEQRKKKRKIEKKKELTEKKCIRTIKNNKTKHK